MHLRDNSNSATIATQVKWVQLYGALQGAATTHKIAEMTRINNVPNSHRTPTNDIFQYEQ